jgi:hypothetical protein
MTRLESKINNMKSTVLVLLFAVLLSGPDLYANSGKEFTTSVIYGTLAGTLVGAATLAFTSNPGDNLNNVARGASYGLYAGILLGLYVTYGMSENQPDAEQAPAPPPRDDLQILEGNPPPAPPSNDSQPQGNRKSFLRNIAVYPLLPDSSRSKDDWGVGIAFPPFRF